MVDNRLTSRQVGRYTSEARTTAELKWNAGGAKGKASSSFMSNATTDFRQTTFETQSWAERTLETTCQTVPDVRGCYIYQMKTTITMSDGTQIDQASRTTRVEGKPLELTYLEEKV